MALVTYLIGSCSGGPAILVDFDSSSLPAVNGNYYLTFSGETTRGCYDIIDNAEPATGVDRVLTLSIDYGDCSTCLIVNPTPTPTPTSTVTPTVTSTPTVTPSITPTKTVTPTVTTTPTLTPTVTPGPQTKNFYSCCDIGGIIYSAKTGTNYIVGSVYIVSAGNCYNATSDGPATAEVDDTSWSPITVSGCSNPECQPCPSPTPTPTSTVTPTVTQTPTQTPTTSVTPTKTVTPTPSITPTTTVTPTKTATPTITPTITPTKTTTPTPTTSVTPTNTQTPTITPTNTTTPTPTPTPTQTPLYQYFIVCCEIEGSIDSYSPHPIYTDADGVEYVQRTAITLGGFNGLNN
jgi:hypothetical protein